MTEDKDITTAGPLSAAALAEFVAQGPCPAGTPGWWQVWGARVPDIEAGDLVLTRNSEGEDEALLVSELFTAKAAPIRQGIIVEGERQTIGMLCPIVLLRRGTHHVLAKSVR